MTDPNMNRFQQRLARIEEQQAAVFAIEQRAASPRARRSLLAVARSLAIAFLALVILKVVILIQIGSLAYESRLQVLRGGTAIDGIGATLLGLDPVTVTVADWVTLRVAPSAP